MQKELRRSDQVTEVSKKAIAAVYGAKLNNALMQHKVRSKIESNKQFENTLFNITDNQH